MCGLFVFICCRVCETAACSVTYYFDLLLPCLVLICMHCFAVKPVLLFGIDLCMVFLIFCFVSVVLSTHAKNWRVLFLME